MAAVDELGHFIDRYDPQVAALARTVLAIGFGPSESASEIPFSIALYPRWVTFFFMQGARLPDPEGILQGSGSQIRSVRLAGANDLDSPAISALITMALAEQPIPKSTGGRLIIKSISPKQRPRIPIKAPRSGQ